MDTTASPDAPAARRRWWHWLVVAVGVLVVVVGIGVVWWIVGAPDAEQDALFAASAIDGVEVAITDDLVTITPTGAAAEGVLEGDTMVFYPGARVPPQAYVVTWAPVVAETGVEVVIPSMPLRLAVLDIDAADGVRDEAADEGGAGVEGEWWVGGHSLGGTMAASFLAGQPEGAWAGLVLWGSYPNGDVLVDRDDLAILSVSGGRDGLSTPDEIDASRTDLPASSSFVELNGVNHAQFGAYGDQGGDLEAEVTDATAHTEIADATTAFLVEVTAPG